MANHILILNMMKKRRKIQNEDDNSQNTVGPIKVHVPLSTKI